MMNEIENGSTEFYVFRNNRRLRTGYTTGSCAAAASKAAAIMLLSQSRIDTVDIETPAGIRLRLAVVRISISKRSSSCAVRKDGGDDKDATHGALVYARVSYSATEGMSIDGGEGVGKVTRKGLDQPPGSAAINTVPRRMISRSVREACDAFGYTGGISIVISVPGGQEIAGRTFNPRLGIVGGISIIGTSGIVEPMSETALVDTIRAEMRMRRSSGSEYLLIVPGNYGKDFGKTFGERYPLLSEDSAVKCSNFVGEAIDCAVEIGAKGLLLVGTLGKLVKLAGGIMNTHSRNADCRMEILAANSLMAGAEAEAARRIMGCITTDDALDILHQEGLLEEVMPMLAERMRFHMDHRAGGGLELGVVVFSKKFGLLGISHGTMDLIEKFSGEVR